MRDILSRLVAAVEKLPGVRSVVCNHEGGELVLLVDHGHIVTCWSKD